MKRCVKILLIANIVGPIAGLAGFGIGYGVGKVVTGIWNKIDDYCYYKKGV